jgi:type II secretory pathway pseudopilin PulG
MRASSTIRRAQGGYILLILMLFLALLAIAATALAPTLAFQARRDREEELIHRGVQYPRAIRSYVKKFGRYPTRLEDLESTNNRRFLRKRYKDPITGKDFKLLHLGEVKMTLAPGMPGATGINPAGMNPAGMNAAGINAAGIAAGLAAAGQATQGISQAEPSTSGTTKPASQKPGDDDSDADPDAPQNPGFSGPVFGGGPIVGVASTSKDKTIREFRDLKRYDKWQFIYDPSTDRGGLLNMPSQPALQGATPAGQMGAPGMPGGMQSRPTQPASQPAPPTQDSPDR